MRRSLTTVTESLARGGFPRNATTCHAPNRRSQAGSGPRRSSRSLPHALPIGCPCRYSSDGCRYQWSWQARGDQPNDSAGQDPMRRRILPSTWISEEPAIAASLYRQDIRRLVPSPMNLSNMESTASVSAVSNRASVVSWRIRARRSKISGQVGSPSGGDRRRQAEGWLHH